MPMRPPSRAVMAILKPSLSAPSSASAGTRHPASASGTVLDPRRPILSSGGPTAPPVAPRFRLAQRERAEAVLAAREAGAMPSREATRAVAGERLADHVRDAHRHRPRRP